MPVRNPLLDGFYQPLHESGRFVAASFCMESPERPISVVRLLQETFPAMVVACTSGRHATTGLAHPL
jgi:hypothetical protein